MADAEEERVLEEKVQFQLKEQRDSLSAVTDALSDDPDNLDLLSVHLQLRQAIKDSEEALFHLNRARLLREADSPLEQTDIEVGSKCRFFHSDGRWYNGLIIGFEEGSEYAKISFLNPISESMLMCRFFQHQQCRFGSNCRLSHGIYIPVSSLKKYCPTIWDQSRVGSKLWALSNTKIWREAKLESYDEKLEMGVVVFRDDGRSAMLGIQSMTLSKYAPPHDFEEEESSDTMISQLSEDYSSDNGGLGFSESANLQSGVQTETAIFAKWENHTRGIASKMMVSMGYRDGMGLGASGQGILDPISVKVLPSKISLDYAVNILGSGGELRKDMSIYSKRKKRHSGRGGKKKQHDRKKVEAAIKAVEAED